MQLNYQDLHKRMTKQAAEHTRQIEELLATVEQKAALTQATLLTDDNLDEKLQSYATTTRDVQINVIREQAQEREAQRMRSKNLRVVGLPEAEDEDVLSTVSGLFKDTLRVASPRIESVKRLGRSSERGPRTILVRFSAEEDKSIVLGNRHLLKGMRIWLEPDLTPSQEADKKKELQKVRDVVAGGWIAYLRGRAVITTKHDADMLIDIPGFVLTTEVCNPRKHAKGRGFGGIAVWIRTLVAPMVSIERVDVNWQFLCVKLGTDKQLAGFLIAAYFAPQGAPVYETLGTLADPFDSLTQVITSLEEIGPVWVLGDFNTRTSNLQGATSEGEPIWRSYDSSNVWVRSAEDTGRNEFTDLFLQLVMAGGLTILNGVARFPSSGGYTFTSAAGNSTVDYLLASKHAREIIESFMIGTLAPESDHRPLICSFSGFQRRE
ncbi:hypothetical protein R1sor_000974 [Riccia sorocarpa]|uniref:Endonuclease/exonuclease/phosphatase domain-containing protein n=1 Tax=Riccia sorocarpa TaxID=122646 RepID=A0ABD3GUM4_9MARC